MDQRQGRSTPHDNAIVDRKDAGHRLKERRLARSIRAYETEDLPTPDIEGDIGQRTLLAVRLGYCCNLQQNRPPSGARWHMGRNRRHVLTQDLRMNRMRITCSLSLVS